MRVHWTQTRSSFEYESLKRNILARICLALPASLDSDSHNISSCYTIFNFMRERRIKEDYRRNKSPLNFMLGPARTYRLFKNSIRLRKQKKTRNQRRIHKEPVIEQNNSENGWREIQIKGYNNEKARVQEIRRVRRTNPFG
jgi:hypothetical protein